MGAALTRLALNTAAAAQGASATMRPRSLAPAAVFSPALTPEKRKPRTSAGPALTRIAILRARLLYGRARQINDLRYEIRSRRRTAQDDFAGVCGSEIL